MGALRTRQEARERLRKAFEAALDKAIPADEAVPLKGSTFLDFEDQAETFRQAVLPTFLEERAGLDDQASVGHGGHCPFCGSPRVYLEKRQSSTGLISPHGEVVLPMQHCRCRECGRTFSPSGAGLGDSGGGGTDPAGGRAGGPGGGGSEL